MKALVLTGRVRSGFDEQDTWAKLAHAFKLDADAFKARILARAPLTIRETADEAEIQRTLNALTNTGADVALAEVDGKWIVQLVGRLAGPTPISYLESEYRAGRLPSDAQVRQATDKDWTTLAAALGEPAVTFDLPPELEHEESGDLPPPLPPRKPINEVGQANLVAAADAARSDATAAATIAAAAAAKAKAKAKAIEAAAKAVDAVRGVATSAATAVASAKAAAESVAAAAAPAVVALSERVKQHTWKIKSGSNKIWSIIFVSIIGYLFLKGCSALTAYIGGGFSSVPPARLFDKSVPKQQREQEATKYFVGNFHTRDTLHVDNYQIKSDGTFINTDCLMYGEVSERKFETTFSGTWKVEESFFQDTGKIFYAAVLDDKKNGLLHGLHFGLDRDEGVFVYTPEGRILPDHGITNDCGN